MLDAATWHRKNAVRGVMVQTFLPFEMMLKEFVLVIVLANGVFLIGSLHILCSQSKNMDMSE